MSDKSRNMPETKMNSDVPIGDPAQTQDPEEKKRLERAYYFNMVDPKSGLRYNIPMLLRSDPEYYYKYIDFMKMKERSSETFEKMLRWD